jgi:hypothetical protein
MFNSHILGCFQITPNQPHSIAVIRPKYLLIGAMSCAVKNTVTSASIVALHLTQNSSDSLFKF